MPKRSSKVSAGKKRPAAPNLLGGSIADGADARDPESAPEPEKNPAAVALGRLGGVKGGPARAAKLTAKRRKEIARQAARTRWSKSD